MSRLRVLLISLVMPLTTGCFWNHAPARSELGADAFYRPIPGSDDRRLENSDRSGAIIRPQDQPAPRVPSAVRQAAPTAAIAPSVQAVANNPSTAPSIPPSRSTGVERSAPATSTAQYLTVGSVVTDVSGTPIYADKVIQAIAPQLAAEAKQRSLDSFKVFARDALNNQIRTMVQTELLVAAANRYLTREEKERAELITMGWRKKQETEAGGSPELARQRARAEGIDFEEKVQQQYRETLVALFFQTKVYPHVQVTANEIRAYYESHLKTQFTETDRARFRLIKISAARVGAGQEGRNRAAELAKEIREKGAAGTNDEFAQLAKTTNHDSLLQSSGGYVTSDGWLPRGAFAVKEVEAAIWKLQPGEVSDVIQVGDNYYIARLEERKLGRVRPFDDLAVQAEITESLKQPQLAARKQRMEEQLLSEAIINPWPPDLTPVMDMAVQNYQLWKKQ
jgi:parvulin-like peptidyl-prolyl isomerase